MTPIITPLADPLVLGGPTVYDAVWRYNRAAQQRGEVDVLEAPAGRDMANAETLLAAGSRCDLLLRYGHGQRWLRRRVRVVREVTQ